MFDWILYTVICDMNTATTMISSLLWEEQCADSITNTVPVKSSDLVFNSVVSIVFFYTL